MFTFNSGSDFYIGWVCVVLLALCAVVAVGLVVAFVGWWLWSGWLAWWLAAAAARRGRSGFAVRVLSTLPAQPGVGVCPCGAVYDHTSRLTVVCVVCGGHHPPRHKSTTR